MAEKAPKQDTIPPAYGGDGKRLNRTIAALVNRGFDIATAARLKNEGYTLGKLQQLTDNALSDLGVAPHVIAVLRKDRPAIPDEVLTSLLISNRFTCCVCRDSSRSIIVHHIVEWSVSRSHAPENLAVLCLLDHDKAHKSGGLSQNLTPELLREFKRAWEEAVVHLADTPVPAETPSSEPGTPSALRDADVQRQAFYARISDEEIQLALDRLRQARFLFGFPTKEEALRLAEKVEQAELAGGSRDVRARALGWCARILSSGETLQRASELVAKSRALAPSPEGDIAEAFVLSNSDRPAAIAMLHKMNSAAARSAVLRMVVNAQSPAAALAWAQQAGLDQNSFDTDGKYTYFLAALLTESWETLFRATATITPSDLNENAALLHVLAMAHVLPALPIGLRSLVASQIPPEPLEIPLSSEATEMEGRRQAQQLFARLADFCRAMGVADAANIASDFALWLELRDPETRATGLDRLRSSMRDPVLSLRRLNMALKVGLKPDTSVIERRLDQSIAFSGTGTGDEAFARYALIFAQKTPKDAASYIAKHRGQLYAHLQKLPIMGIEVELLAQSGQITAAKERLAEMVEHGIGANELEGLNIVLMEATGKDPVAERRALYDRTGEVRALRNLADALEERRLFEDLLPYAEKLFAETHDVNDCFLVARCLDQLNRYGELFRFLSANQALVRQSTNLQAMSAWALWREGRFSDAQTELDGLASFSHTASHRALRVNLAISSGNWAALNDYCNEAWADRANLSAEELLYAAQLAQAVGNSHDKELVLAATEKAPDDPAVLTSAYSRATQGGWENEAKVAGWIERAAARSGEDGPIKMVSLKELVEQKPAWDKQANDVAAQLTAGKLPVFAAAELLHRSMIDLNVAPALSNPGEADVRRRGIVYAYSGARPPVSIPANATVAVELGALFTLAQLNLLDELLQNFKVIIPHSTLGWLFKERAKAHFHQPSRVKDAELLKQLVNARAIAVLTEPPEQDSVLVRDIGKDLADMLVLAKNQSEAGTPTAVVRSPPIYLAGSLMDEEADISVYRAHLVSCGAVVDVLKAKGAITAQEEARARAYLQTQERAWPDEPSADGNTHFLLDGLSVSHLRTAGVLKKLKTAGLTVSISRSDDDEANAFIAMASLTDEQLSLIDRIRATLEAGLASGIIKASRAMKADDQETFQSHPTYTVLLLAEPADVLLIDDRSLSQHPNMTTEARIAPIVTSLDVLDHLYGIGILSETDLYNHRTTLRRCGYQIIPPRLPELRAHLLAAKVVDGAIVETAELKAVRESLIQLRMSKILQLPLEAPALQQTQIALIQLIREVWLLTDGDDVAAARADWLLPLSDIRGWASAAEPGQRRNFAVFGYAQYVLQLSAAAVGAEKPLRERYFSWVSTRVLDQLERSEPEVFAWLIERMKTMMTDGIKEALDKQQ